MRVAVDRGHTAEVLQAQQHPVGEGETGEGVAGPDRIPADRSPRRPAGRPGSSSDRGFAMAPGRACWLPAQFTQAAPVVPLPRGPHSSERPRLAAVGRDPAHHLAGRDQVQLVEALAQLTGLGVPEPHGRRARAGRQHGREAVSVPRQHPRCAAAAARAVRGRTGRGTTRAGRRRWPPPNTVTRPGPGRRTTGSANAAAARGRNPRYPSKRAGP